MQFFRRASVVVLPRKQSVFISATRMHRVQQRDRRPGASYLQLYRAVCHPSFLSTYLLFANILIICKFINNQIILYQKKSNSRTSKQNSKTRLKASMTMVGKSGLQIQVEVEEQIRKLQLLQLQPQPDKIPQPLQQLQPPSLPPLLSPLLPPPPPSPPSPPSPPMVLRSKRRRMQRFAERSQRSKSWHDWPPLAEGRFLIGPRLGAGGSAEVRLSFFVYSNNRN